jgi:hypothetical protein
MPRSLSLKVGAGAVRRTSPPKIRGVEPAPTLALGFAWHCECGSQRPFDFAQSRLLAKNSRRSWIPARGVGVPALVAIMSGIAEGGDGNSERRRKEAGDDSAWSAKLKPCGFDANLFRGSPCFLASSLGQLAAECKRRDRRISKGRQE